MVKWFGAMRHSFSLSSNLTINSNCRERASIKLGFFMLSITALFETKMFRTGLCLDRRDSGLCTGCRLCLIRSSRRCTASTASVLNKSRVMRGTFTSASHPSVGSWLVRAHFFILQVSLLKLIFETQSFSEPCKTSHSCNVCSVMQIWRQWASGWKV